MAAPIKPANAQPIEVTARPVAGMPARSDEVMPKKALAARRKKPDELEPDGERMQADAQAPADGPVVLAQAEAAAAAGGAAEGAAAGAATQGAAGAAAGAGAAVSAGTIAAVVGGVGLAAAAGGGGSGGGKGASAPDAPAPVQSPDTTAPTVTISADKAVANSSGSVTYTFTFSEAVSGFSADDVSVANGSKGTFAKVSDTVYTLVVTPAAGMEDSLTVGVAAGAAADAAGNAAGAASKALTLDTIAPTVTIADDEAGVASIAGGSVTYTFTFSQAVSGFSADDVTLAHGTKGTFTKVSDTTYTLVVTPEAGFEGDMTVDVAAGVASDAAGNASAAAAQSAQVVDTRAPAIESMDVDGGALVLVFTGDLDAAKLPGAHDFNILVDGAARPVTDVQVSGNTVTLSFGTPIAAGNNVQATYTDPSAGNDANAVQDATGNDASSFSSGTVADGYVRGAQIYIDANGNGVADPSEMLAGVKTNANGNFFLPADAPAGAIIAVGGFNIDTGVPNTMPLKAPAGATMVTPLTTLVQSVFESNGGSLSDANEAVAAALGLPTTVNLSTFDPLAVLSAAPDNAEALAIQKAAAQVATIITLATTAAPAEAAQVASAIVGNIVGSVNAGTAIDLADTATVTGMLPASVASVATEAVTASQEIKAATSITAVSQAQSAALDTIAPDAPVVIDLITDSGDSFTDNVTNAANPVVRVMLDTTSTDGKAAVIGNTVTLLNNGAAVGTRVITEQDFGKGYVDITVATAFATDGTQALTARVTDAANLTSPLSSPLAVVYDGTRPNVAIASNPAALKAGETATITFTLSEASTGFALSDVVVSGGTLSNFAGSGATYTATFTPAENSTAAATINVPAGRFTDTAGNAGNAAGELSIAIDTVVPTVQITTSDTALKAGEMATLTFTLSEPASGFSAADVTVAGGTLSNFVAIDATTYTADFTPAPNRSTPATVSVGAGVFADAAGNGNAAASLDIATDTLAPGVTITFSGDVVTFTLSEGSTDFGVEDVVTVGGTLESFSGSGSVYTARFVAAGEVGTVQVLPGSFTDAAGNPGAGAGPVQVGADTTAPKLTITDDVATGAAAGDITYTFTFDKAVSGFATSSITVDGGTKGELVKLSDLVYTLVVKPTPGAEGNVTVSVAAGAAADAAGNPSAAATSAAQPFDTLAPTVAAGPVAGGVEVSGTESGTIRIGTTVVGDLGGAPKVLGAQAAVVSGQLSVTDAAGNAGVLAGKTVGLGTTGNDSVTGGADADIVLGFGGDDVLVGLGGNDTLIGGAGRDTLAGGAGNDFLDGGTITDTVSASDGNVVSYLNDGGPVTVNLQTGAATDGGGGTDTLANINIVVGSAGNDVITGSDRNIGEGFDGGAGNDTIDGGAINLATQLNTNRVLYTSAEAAVTVDLAAGTAGGGAGNDVLANINAVRGSRFDDTLGGSDHPTLVEVFEGMEGNDTIDGRGGFDRVDYGLSGAAVNVTLGGSGNGSAQDGLGGIDVLRNIEGARGTTGNDTLTGSDITATVEAFEGRAGNDTIDGRGGVDRVEYTQSTAGVNVDLAGGQAGDGMGGTDTLLNIENVRGGNFDDSIAGSLANNHLEGGNGNDQLDGKAGNDILAGGGGNDTLTGGAGTDTFAFNLGGSNGIDRITDLQLGEMLNFMLPGGGMVSSAVAGSDPSTLAKGQVMVDAAVDGVTRMYVGTGAGHVTIELAGVFTAGDFVAINESWGSGLRYDGAPSAGATADDDTLAGTGGNDTINAAGGNDSVSGGDGNDLLAGGEGNDTLLGEAGNDTLIGGFGSDFLGGGAGSDHIDGGEVLDRTGFSDLNTVTYNGAGGPVNVDLRGITGDGSVGAGTASFGNGDLDTLANIQVVIGTGHADTIVGSSAVIFEQFQGGAGNDTIDGGAITDGNNSNRASYNDASEAVLVDLAAGTAIAGAFGSDTLININQVRGSFHHDTLLGSDNGPVAEQFEGRQGNNHIDGRGGYDIARFDQALGVDVNLASGVAKTVFLTGAAPGSPTPFTDTLVNIEGVRGSNGNDTISGNWANNGLEGMGGDDAIHGGDGNDTLTGGAGSDTLEGGHGIDIIQIGDGGSARDVVRIDVGHSVVGAADQVLGGFDVSSSDASKHDVLVLASAEIAANTGGNVTGTASGIFRGHEIVDGIVTLKDAGGNPVMVNEGNRDAAIGYLAANFTTPGVTVALRYDSPLNPNGIPDALLVFQDNGTTTAHGGAAIPDTLVVVGLGESVAPTAKLGNTAGDGVVQIMDGFAPEPVGFATTGNGMKLDFAEKAFMGDGVALELFKNGTDKMNITDILGSGTTSISVVTDKTLAASDWFLLRYTATNASNGIADAAGHFLHGDEAEHGGTAEGSAGNNVINLSDAAVYNKTGGYDINGAGGNDALTGSNFADYISGDEGNDTMLGGGGNDVLLGGAGSDVLSGGAGSDHLDGGAVVDRVNFSDLNTVSFAQAGVAVHVNLGGVTGDGGIGTGIATAGSDVDTLANVQVVIGSGFNDTLTGSGAMIFEQFQGGAGNDTINGGAITDGINSNRASYQDAGAGVSVDLATGIASGANIGTDTLININQVRGSGFNDTLSGSDNGPVAEQFEGRAGNNRIDGRGGHDIVRFDQAVRVEVDLDAGIAETVFLTGPTPAETAFTDTLFNIEGVRGSSGDDDISGNWMQNTLEGMNGNDYLYGDDGNDTLTGGAGSDTLEGGYGVDVIQMSDGGAHARDRVVIGLGQSVAGAVDQILGGFDIGSADIANHDVLALASDLIAADTTGDVTGTASGIFHRHAIAGGIVTLKDADGNAVTVNEGNRAAAVGYLSANFTAAGTTVALRYDSPANPNGIADSLLVFQDNGITDAYGGQTIPDTLVLVGLGETLAPVATLGNEAGANVVQIVDGVAPEPIGFVATSDGFRLDFQEKAYADGVAMTLEKNGTEAMNITGIEGEGTTTLHFHTDQDLDGDDWFLLSYNGDSAANAIRDAAGNFLPGDGPDFGGSAEGSAGNNSIDLSGAGYDKNGYDLNGAGGHDTLVGSAADDWFTGGTGADVMTGGGGSDGWGFGQGDSTVVTYADGGAAGLGNGDTFSFAGGLADIITDLSQGEGFELRVSSEVDGKPGLAEKAALAGGQAADQGYFKVQGSYSAGVFTVGDAGADTLVVYDGLEGAGTTQTALVLSGVTLNELSNGGSYVSHL